MHDIELADTIADIIEPRFDANDRTARMMTHLTHLIAETYPSLEATEVTTEAVQTLADALEREQRWTELANALPLMIWRSPPAGRITTFINQHFSEYTDLRGEAGLGLAWREVVHPEDLPRLWVARRYSIDMGLPWAHEFRIRRRDGVWRWHLGRAVPMRARSGEITGWVGFATEIHDVRDFEARLWEAEDRLAFAVRATEAGVYEIDCTTGQKHYSRRTFDLLGITPPTDFTTLRGGMAFACINPEQFWARIHPDDKGIVEEALRRAYDPDSGADGVYEAEYRVRAGDESDPQSPTQPYRWIASQGRVTFDTDATEGRKPLRLLGLLRDVTDKKREEAERNALVHRREQIAEAVQRSLLLVPAPDAYPGLTIAPLYQPAWKEALIGGDFFDVFAVSEGRIALLVGDASGKGVQAATYTAEIKFALRAFLRECGGSPSATLTRLNAFVLENARLDAAHKGCLYTTAALAVVDTTTSMVTISTAGAEPPLIVRRATDKEGETEQCNTGGMMLGVLTDEIYTEQTYVMQCEDLLVMATDGILEARIPASAANGRRSGDIFGVEGLRLAIRQAAIQAEQAGAAELPEIGRHVIHQALAHAHGHQHDDICLLVARLHGRK